MDENEIVSALKKYQNFGGCFAKDEIPPHVVGPVGIIVNTDVRAKPGSHWVAIFIDANNQGELFDSLASFDVLKEFKAWMEINTTSFLFPSRPLQSAISKLCGVYCIAFLGMRFTNQSFNDVMKVFSQHPINNDLTLASLLQKIKEAGS